jgi:multidrug efflux pump subunit AcrA (membrane-fusion protein)
VIPRAKVFLPLALAIGLIAAGCGSDSSGETTAPSVSIPAVTTPGISTSTTPVTTAAPGTTVTGKSGKTYNPNAPDSATNDVPPAKGSPQAQFEQQCKQQGTCD